MNFLLGLVRGCEAGAKARRPKISASQGVEVEIIDVPFRAVSRDQNDWNPIKSEEVIRQLNTKAL